MNREQLQNAAVQCTAQEQQVEILQLSLLPSLSDEWQTRATGWCLIAIQQIQQNAVVLDGLLEQLDEGKSVDASSIPQEPAEYIRLLALEAHKEKLKEPQKWFDIAIKNNVILFNLLLFDSSIDPSAHNNLDIQTASKKGYIAIVERLLQDPRVDPSTFNNCAIRWASQFGHLAVVDRLLQDARVDPSTFNNCAIRGASEFGHLAIVERLLQDARVDPSADNNYAIRYAFKNGHLAVVDRIKKDPRVNYTCC